MESPRGLGCRERAVRKCGLGLHRHGKLVHGCLRYPWVHIRYMYMDPMLGTVVPKPLQSGTTALKTRPGTWHLCILSCQRRDVTRACLAADPLYLPIATRKLAWTDRDSWTFPTICTVLLWQSRSTQGVPTRDSTAGASQSQA